MRRHGIHFAGSLIVAFLMFAPVTRSTASQLSQTDVPQSKDSPFVSRFAGSTIIAYHQAEYDEVALPMGPIKASTFTKTLPATGRVTRIVYASPAGKTTAEVFANFRNVLQGGGFKLLYSCTDGASAAGKGCGGINFDEVYAKAIMERDGKHYNQMLDLLHSTNEDERYLLAELQRDGRQVDIGLLVTQNQSNPVGVLLQVIESGQMPMGQVIVDSAAMIKGLQNEGKIALYGLQFATDSTDLQPDSEPTLKQMSELLHQQPKLKVYIVGHTDDSGSLEHNLALSQRRAESVVQALTSRFGIAPDRLTAKGLASYAPVATNHSEAGKAKNRRVEMV